MNKLIFEPEPEYLYACIESDESHEIILAHGLPVQSFETAVEAGRWLLKV